MGSAVPEIGLDLKLCAMKTVGGFLKEAFAIDDGDGKVAKLEEYVRNLEMERGKIEVFKRELPLCMQLLVDVIEGLKEELERCRNERDGHVQEFIPLKSKFEEEQGVKLEADSRDKMDWMSSVQLWSDNYSNSDNNSNDNEKKSMEEREDKTKNNGVSGAFLPFKRVSAVTVSSKKEEKVTVTLPDLSLLSPGIKSSCPGGVVTGQERRGDGLSSNDVERAPMSSPATSGVHLTLQQSQQQQSQRKTRRCWSPELHRRFVVALQQLGGAQVATPKQIRELMKVDGLTNDEVKSHLQKYRLHTRRMPIGSGAVNRPVVAVGGLWVPQETYTTSQQSTSQSGSPQGPLQLTGSSTAVSVTAGDSCEEEDGKSESYSWK
ncbi:myb family transcription factor EFM-like [Typha angustifolia]|uniref:myb family transcription factor EFM-like n=1 Tax=Typha angustifolia TaxID=59011 RepID=UPI003C2C63DB